MVRRLNIIPKFKKKKKKANKCPRSIFFWKLVNVILNIIVCLEFAFLSEAIFSVNQTSRFWHFSEKPASPSPQAHPNIYTQWCQETGTPCSILHTQLPINPKVKENETALPYEVLKNREQMAARQCHKDTEALEKKASRAFSLGRGGRGGRGVLFSTYIFIMRLNNI